MGIIAMIAPADSGYEDEVCRYHLKRRVLEFRLKIDFENFRDADEHTRESLLADGLRRSLDLVPSMNVRDLDLQKLISDFEEIATHCGWAIQGPRAA